MANWTVTQNTLIAVPLTFETVGQSVSLTINPNYGYAISAANFIIGGATEITSSTAGEYIFEGGNVDAEVEKVVFSDIGIAGQPTNTVNAQVYFNAMPSIPATVETWPANDTIYVDIDDRSALSDPIDPNSDVPGPAVDTIERLVCLKTLWDYSSVQTVTVASLSNIDETTTQGDATTQPNCVHSGNVNEGDTTVIAKITFAMNDTAANFYVGVGASFEGLTNQGYDYSSYYSSEIEYTYTSNLVTSFTVYISYTPPTNPPLNPDPQPTFNKFCEMGHQAFINYGIKETESVTGDQVRSVSYNPSVPFTGGSEAIAVRGSVGATYSLTVQKKASTTSATPGSSPNYNFTKCAFEAAPVIEYGTIGSRGYKIHYVEFVGVAIDTRYDIVLTATGTSSLHADVPNDDGEAIVTQYGINTATIKPYSTNSNYESFDAAASKRVFYRPKPYTGDNYGRISPTVVRAKGGNGGSSSTRVLLNTPIPTNVEPDMIVCVKNTTGASIITHETTVKSLYKNILTLSAAAAIPNDTELLFIKNNSGLVSFSVIADGTGGRNLTATGGSPSAIDIVSGVGSEDIGIDVAGDVNNSTTIALEISSSLQVGMKVTGYGIAGEVDSDGVIFTNITAVNPSGRTITVVTAQTLGGGSTLTFSSSDTATIQTGIRPLDIQYSVNTSTDIATIQGYLLVEDITATGDILLNIDTIVTNS